MIYGHGDDLYRYGNAIKINFSSNIYQHADLGALKEHLARKLDSISNYPEPAPLSLEKNIAEECGVNPEEVMATGGATEAIYSIAALMAEKKDGDRPINVIARPTFSEYADACRMHGCTITDGHNATPGRKVYWICNPNNPTGGVAQAEKLLETADNRPEDVFIIDQSYEHYTIEPMIADKEAVRRNNIILLHSMTKRFCVPGLRLGYATACRETIDKLKQTRRPWSISTLSMEAGMFLIRNNVKAIPPLESYLGEARRLRRELGAIGGINVIDTKTNFMLASIDGGDAAHMKDLLAVKYGLLIRDASNFDGLDKSFFRIAAQSAGENDILVAAVKEYMANA